MRTCSPIPPMLLARISTLHGQMKENGYEMHGLGGVLLVFDPQ